ncbi:MAG: GntR family transcriptional regulator [Chitinivibrionales bacterium]|nr:GntR family transcriptional regulator [Chitinivibrionales bacterium]
MQGGQAFKAWLLEHIESLPPGGRLPTDSALAERWQLSPRTVRRIMAPLRKQGLLVRVPGKGTFKPSPSDTPASETVEAPQSSEERLADTLAGAIYRGELRRGDALPQVKFLCLQYHVSEKTVAAAYRRLRDRGLVRKVGKRYWVGSLMPSIRSTVRKEVWVVVRTDADLPHVYTDDYMGPAYQKMERELRSSGLLLRYADRERFRNLQRVWLAKESFPAGVVFWDFDGKEWDDIAPLVKTLTGTVGNPRTSVLIDIANVGKLETAPPRIQILSRGNLTTNQSRSVAALIAGLDVKEVLVLFDGDHIREDPRHGYLRYYKTMYEIIQTAGRDRQVRQVVLSTEPDPGAEWFAKHVFEPEREYVGYLRRKYASVTNAPGSVLDKTPHVARSADEIVERFGRQSVWVCTRGHLAANAAVALESARVKVPEESSIVALEDNPRYYHLGLTVCAPDWDLVGYLMAHALIGDFPLERTHRRFIKAPCPAVERFTTPKR